LQTKTKNNWRLQVKGKGEKFRGLKTWQQQESNLSAAVAAPFYQSFVGANINKQ